MNDNEKITKIIKIDCIQTFTLLKIIKLTAEIQSLNKLKLLVFLSIKE